MSWYYDADGREQKEKVKQNLLKRQKRGEVYEAFEAPAGNKLAVTFWGQAWCRHLETYGGYESRLPRGRSYLRAGNVYNLSVGKGIITAEVTGSSLYDVEVRIPVLEAGRWDRLKKACQGQVSSLLDLLGGKLGDQVMQVVVNPDDGLFPGRREIRHQCTCPDSADLCKHQAAVLYAVGVLFDRDPRMFFSLRGMDPAELIAGSAELLTAPVGGEGTVAGEVDLGELFGIDLVDFALPEAVPEEKVKPAAGSTLPAPPSPARAGKVAARTPALKKMRP